ncbi:MAG TPA: molybdopterin-dependent oxidoreductase [Pyrinomonadaceae bacterium]|nr:molybdopterin-dependent oxidoreductase [Pyrinomonadaceae bacterium]
MKPKELITRRNILIAGVTSVGGLLLSGCSRKLPPTYGNVLRMADTFTYAAHQILLPGESLAREYSHNDITSFPATGTTNPGDPDKPNSSEIYRNLERGGFADWRLAIEGLVAKPGTYSLADLKRFPSRTQITRHVCEEGWCAIGEWTGVQLSRVLDAAGMLPNARFVTFYSYDEWIDCIDMLDALHPQTLLAYGMNGRDLSIPHGAPVRLRVERQMGYKSMKYIQRIVIKEEFDDGGMNGNILNGWSWYAGI